MGNLFAAGLRRPALECEIVSCPQARERRRTGIHLGFGSRPRPLPTGAVSIGAGIRDGAWAQLADPKTKGRGSGGNGSGRRLVIVESPTKARKLASYLGSGYIVESSRGHIRDLPRAASDVPAKYKSQPWARLGVNVDADFEPLYIISPEKRSTVSELRGLLKDVDELYLATDGDREGEAIAWHLLETLKPRIPVKRMVFHEITEPAIRAAAEHPRDLDIDLVDAQETRRILDRLYGYEVSPVLWKKVAPKLSAGRVPSVVRHRRRVDARCGQDRAPAMAARAARAEGLDSGGRQPGGRPLFAGPGSTRAGHPFSAGVGADEGRDCAHPDRYPGDPTSAAD
ncbi:DNA topoisomerase 1 [Mycobacterium tuberculosis M1438]|nr:DNA topoisomerase 1 [Mycobacterium tuberculosis M1438]